MILETLLLEAPISSMDATMAPTDRLPSRREAPTSETREEASDECFELRPDTAAISSVEADVSSIAAACCEAAPASDWLADAICDAAACTLSAPAAMLATA